jgi:hypothetical protein
LTEGSAAGWVSLDTSAGLYLTGSGAVLRDKFHWGTKRGFVHCFKSNALNLDLD